MNDNERFNLSTALGGLPVKEKAPNSSRVLDAWIIQAENKLGSTKGRLGWLVASTVVAAALQQAVDERGGPLFLLKGGTWLQHRLPGSRATTDLDGLVRGDMETLLGGLDEVLQRPWGPLRFRRDPVEVINVPNKIVKPRRFDVVLIINGVTWRRIQVEVSPEEGGDGEAWEDIPSPALGVVGLPAPDHLVGLAMRYQIAQKFHAGSDPHEPPGYLNERPRDLVDLLLLKDLTESTDSPTLPELKQAGVDIFEARAAEAEALGLVPRRWPPIMTAYPHWADDYAKAAASAGVAIGLAEAVAVVNQWIGRIDAG
ncbi:MAG: nucleotidyl transferase AbiEii/AbiGii toxin family protein [Propionibacteriaceae bacterium]|jgi:hypothetical protein|nr:nucleotidyl transferase AbiEii/AbiGii toxin family protein [Propionibacteriaceae bacterium]